MMGEAEIQDRVTELAAARNEKVEVDAQEVLIEMLRILRADALQAFNDDGTIKLWQEIPIDCRRAITGIKVQETFEGSGDDREWTGRIKEIKFWSKDHAIEMLARHLALFKDSLDLNVRPTGDASDMETSARVACILEAARRRHDGADDLV
jgi:phage terminase small subunit